MRGYQHFGRLVIFPCIWLSVGATESFAASSLRRVLPSLSRASGVHAFRRSACEMSQLCQFTPHVACPHPNSKPHPCLNLEASTKCIIPKIVRDYLPRDEYNLLPILSDGIGDRSFREINYLHQLFNIITSQIIILHPTYDVRLRQIMNLKLYMWKFFDAYYNVQNRADKNLALRTIIEPTFEEKLREPMFPENLIENLTNKKDLLEFIKEVDPYFRAYMLADLNGNKDDLTMRQYKDRDINAEEIIFKSSIKSISIKAGYGIRVYRWCNFGTITLEDYYLYPELLWFPLNAFAYLRTFPEAQDTNITRILKKNLIMYFEVINNYFEYHKYYKYGVYLWSSQDRSLEEERWIAKKKIIKF